MKRVVSLWLPTWPTDRLRRRLGDAAPPPDHPLVLVGRDRRRRILTACDPTALKLGLRPGMAATQAHALVPGLVPHDADPAGDAEALGRLALWALHHYAPVCAADAPDGLAIDATGAAHLKGGERALIDDLVSRLTTAGLGARAVVAPTYGAAHAVARYRRDLFLVEADAIGRAIGPLPLAALRLSTPLVDSLKRMGFDTVAEVERQPRAPLALRFGPELGRRLDQAYGRTFEPIRPVVAVDVVQSARTFAEPIGAAETIARFVAELVTDVCATLETRGQGARRLDLLCHRVDNHIEAVRIAPPGRCVTLTA